MLISGRDGRRGADLLSELTARYGEVKSKGLSLDLSRGKPGREQLDLSNGMLGALRTAEDCRSAEGDCRSYGMPDGVPEARALLSELYGIPARRIVPSGSSSLSLIYGVMLHAMLFGLLGGDRPWGRERRVKLICPVPGYDRHFRICETLGIGMINVPMTETGPDIEAVERIAASDPTVKGIVCCPKYSNPDGVTYSRDTVRALASMKTAAGDFRIFWDNAYALHDLYPEHDGLADVFSAAEEAGNPDRVFYFASTSKICFPGSGVAFLAASEASLESLRPYLRTRAVCGNNMEQMRLVRFFGTADAVRRHMERHAELLRPRFELAEAVLDRELTSRGLLRMRHPRGGYFLSLYLPHGTAARTCELCRGAGLTLTPAGATYPYGRDPDDSNLRLAPSAAEPDGLAKALDLLTLCVRIAALEKQSKEKEV